jgi:hypothetical protein
MKAAGRRQGCVGELEGRRNPDVSIKLEHFKISATTSRTTTPLPIIE